MNRWAQGQTAVLRYTDLDRAEVLHAWPTRVVQDDPDLTALYVPDGTVCKLGRRLDRRGPMALGPHVVEDAVWRRDLLRLMFPGHAYSIWLLWDPAPRQFVCWYVNLEAPYVRTALGFDTVDYELDIVIEPDLTHRWKDEDDLAEVVAAGLLTRGQARDIRAQGERVLRLVADRKPPFCDGWERWVPNEGWALPVLPAGWDVPEQAAGARRPSGGHDRARK